MDLEVVTGEPATDLADVTEWRTSLNRDQEIQWLRRPEEQSKR